jgi:predicted transcriptional regulator
MINKEHQKTIKKALIKQKGKGLSLSDMERELPLVRCQIRVAVAGLEATGEIEEEIYGRSKVYYLA